MKRTVILILIACVSLFAMDKEPVRMGPTCYDQIMTDYENGLISLDEKVLYLAQSIRDHDQLPERYINLPLRRSQTLTMMEIYNDRDNLSESGLMRVLEYLDRPSGASSYFDTDHFRIHYSGSAPTEIGDYMEDAYDFCHETLDYLTPPSDGGSGGNNKYDVYIVPTETGVLGYCAPEASGPNPWPDATSYLVVSTQAMMYGDSYKKITTVHEYFHATQFAYDASDAERFYYEHSSCWSEVEKYPMYDIHLDQMYSFFNNPDWSLRTYNGDYEYGSWHFNQYIDQTMGRNVIREIWEETRYSGMLTAWQTVFSSHGTSRNEVLKEFHVWNYFTGSRAAVHGEYTDAAEWPEVAITRTHTAYPASGGPTDAPDNFGSNYIEFDVPAGASGPFSVIFDGENGYIWGAQLILVGAGGYTVGDISLNSYGYGDITFPEDYYTGATKIVLVVSVLSTSGENLDYVYNAEFAEIEPTYEPARNLVATSGISGEVPLEWDGPIGGGLSDLTELYYDDGTPAGILPMSEYGIIHEFVSFSITTACTLKQVKIYASGAGSMTCHVWPDGGGGTPDTGTDLVTPFDIPTTGSAWAVQDVPGGGVYLEAGDYVVGVEREEEAVGLYLDAESTDSHSGMEASDGFYTMPYDYLLRIMVKSTGGSSSGLTGYQIYRGTSMGAISSSLGMVTEERYTDEAVTDGVTYYYQVSAIYDGALETPRSNIAMAVPNEVISGIDTLYEHDDMPDGYIRWTAGVDLGQLFEVETPVEILEIQFLTGGTGFFIPGIHPYNPATGRVHSSIIPSYETPVVDGGWTTISLESFGGAYVNDDFIVAYGNYDTLTYLARDEDATDTDCWINNGIWQIDDENQYFIRAIVRELDTTETHALSGHVYLSRGSGGSEPIEDLSGSVVRVLGTELLDTTDTDGSYMIDNIPPGNHDIKVTHPTYEAALVGIGFEGDEYQDFSLLPFATPLNPPSGLVAMSYFDSQVPLFWSLPVGAPGTYDEISYTDGDPYWYYGGVDDGDVQVQHFTTYFPCTLQYAGIIFYDSVGIYTDVAVQVFADDGEGYPDFTRPLSEELDYSPEGYPSWDVVDLRDEDVVLEAGQSFHIAITNTANHSFVVADTIKATSPSRSKIFWSESRARSDSIPEFFFNAIVRYTGWADIAPREETFGTLRDGIPAARASVEGPDRSYYGVLGTSEISETEEAFAGILGYEVYRGTDPEEDLELVTTVPPDSASYLDEDVENGTTYYYELKTVYNHGRSESPRMADATPMAFNDTAHVLLVDDDGSGFLGAANVFEPYKLALDELGIGFNTYEVCCSLGAPGPSADVMGEYDVVIWFTGQGYRDGWTLTEDDETEIAEYIDGGGSFALFSSDYIWDRFGADWASFVPGDFLFDYVNLGTVEQDNWTIGATSPFNATGMTGGFAEGLRFSVSNEYFAPGSVYVDHLINHESTQVLGFGPTGISSDVGIANPGSDKVFFSSLPFEALVDGTGDNTRTEFMRRLITDYCGLFAPSGDTAITIDIPLFAGWNMLSIPLEMDDPDMNTIFPSRVGDVYHFNAITGAYVTITEVTPGEGFFVLMPEDGTVSVSGMPIDYYAIEGHQGWNQIGAVLPDSIFFSHIDLDSPVELVGSIYSYNSETGGYEASLYLKAPNAYWALLNGDSEIRLPEGGGESLLRAPTETEYTISLNSSYIELAAGDLYIDAIPPTLPDGRGTSSLYIEADYPARKMVNPEGIFTIYVEEAGRATITGGELMIDGTPSTASVYLAKGRHDVRISTLPTEAAITGIVPNPFNAACEVSFSLPEEMDISLRAYDMSGKEVDVIAEGTKGAGQHRVVWNPELASGVYLVRLSTPEWTSIERVMLMK